MTTATITAPKRLIAAHKLCATTEGKSFHSVNIRPDRLEMFSTVPEHSTRGQESDRRHRNEIRGFISYLQQTPCYASRPFSTKKNVFRTPH
jgi:hypothetical protein